MSIIVPYQLGPWRALFTLPVLRPIFINRLEDVVVTPTQLPQLPFTPIHPLHAHDGLRELQARGAIHRVRTPEGDEAWYVTSYELLRRLMDDPRLGRTHRTPDEAPRYSGSVFLRARPGFDTEAVDHARMRGLLTPHFAPKHLRTLARTVDNLTASALDALEEVGPPADLHQHLAEPLPILVICELLGVPYEDRDQFTAWAADIVAISDRARSEQAMGELFSYGMSLVTRKRKQPGDDVISRLCAVDDVDDLEAATLSMQLLFAGHETTVVTIAMGALNLLSDPEQWRALVGHPERVTRAVEEMLRTASPGGTAVARWAREDFECEGITIRSGELVMLDMGAANHDEAAFPDPDRFDVERRGQVHVSFGYGPRYCVGAALARMELKAVFTQLPSRFPTLRLAVAPEEVDVRADAIAGGISNLPVTW